MRADRALQLEFAEYHATAARDFQLVADSGDATLAPLAYFGLGMIARFRHPRLAEDSFQSVLKFSTRSVFPNALLELGRLAERAGDIDRARVHYRRLLAEFPDSEASAQVAASFR